MKTATEQRNESEMVNRLVRENNKLFLINEALLYALKAVEKDYNNSSTGAIRTETIDIVLETIKNAEQ
jgi:hypothetical protein